MGFPGSIEHAVHEYGYAAVGLGLLFEHFGLPLPGETMLIGAAVLASQGELGIKLLLVTAWAGATVGNLAGYAIGRSGGHWLIMKYGGRVGVTHEKLAQVEALFARYGDALIVGARFIVLLRQLSGLVAGTLEMKWARFAIFNAIGAALWVLWWGLLSYWLGKRVFVYLSHFAGAQWGLLALAALALVIATTRIYRRKRTSQ